MTAPGGSPMSFGKGSRGWPSMQGRIRRPELALTVAWASSSGPTPRRCGPGSSALTSGLVEIDLAQHAKLPLLDDQLVDWPPGMVPSMRAVDHVGGQGLKYERWMYVSSSTVSTRH